VTEELYVVSNSNLSFVNLSSRKIFFKKIEEKVMCGISSLFGLALSYPHFGPKNTRATSFLFLMPFQFTVYYSAIYYCASPASVTVSASKFFLHIFLAFYSKFLHKIIQKGVLVISRNGTHFEPLHLSLSLFNLSVQIMR